MDVVHLNGEKGSESLYISEVAKHPSREETSFPLGKSTCHKILACHVVKNIARSHFKLQECLINGMLGRILKNQGRNSFQFSLC